MEVWTDASDIAYFDFASSEVNRCLICPVMVLETYLHRQEVFHVAHDFVFCDLCPPRIVFVGFCIIRASWRLQDRRTLFPFLMLSLELRI